MPTLAKSDRTGGKWKLLDVLASNSIDVAPLVVKVRGVGFGIEVTEPMDFVVPASLQGVIGEFLDDPSEKGIVALNTESS